MKNLIKRIGIIAIVAVIGFSMTGCELGEGGTLVVQNDSNSPISTTVTVRGGSTVMTPVTGDSIPANSSKSYLIEENSSVTVTAIGWGLEGGTFFPFEQTVNVNNGATVTVTVR